MTEYFKDKVRLFWAPRRGGHGWAIAKALARPAKVVIGARACGTYGIGDNDRRHGVACDASQESQIEHLAEVALATHGARYRGECRICRHRQQHREARATL